MFKTSSEWNMTNKILSTVLAMFGVFLSLAALVMLVPSIAYELRDSAKGTGYNET
jgi:hypothetical protein